MQENRAREVAEVQRRHRDRLQCAAKRRSTATCSSRDKEMEGVALESVLQNFLSNRVSRRRLGRPSSSHGSPTGGSPRNGSLTEITSQVNLPSEIQKKGEPFRIKEMSKKEWNSAGELTENSLPKQRQAKNEDYKAKCSVPHEDERKLSTREDSKVVAPPVNRTASVASSGRSFSANTDDDDEEEELKDNSEEEAQKLREASRKVLRFQNSRGSVSSGEFCLENQKSPCAKTKLPRQRTFDEETDRYPDEPSNEDLVRLLMGSQTISKTKLGCRHTLPSKVAKTEEEPDNLGAQPPIQASNSVLTEKGVTLPAESPGNNSSNHVFDFTNISHLLKTAEAQEPMSPSAEKKSKSRVSETHTSDEVLGAQSQESKSIEPVGNNLQRNSENKSTWFKTDTSGMFFSFFKRLGDMSKQQPSNKESVYKGSDSSV